MSAQQYTLQWTCACCLNECQTIMCLGRKINEQIENITENVWGNAVFPVLVCFVSMRKIGAKSIGLAPTVV